MKVPNLALYLVFCAAAALAGGRHLEVSYPASSQEEELQMGVTYTIWIPDGVTRVRAVIVHQHGCGAPAAKGGATAAYDLHWQALAQKWDAALLGPSYHQDDKQDCRLWSDPRKGSDQTFQRALKEFASRSGRAELATAPWCLWGHSGGGFWVGIMSTLHAERVVAVWYRSGAPSNETDVPEAVYSIPAMCNPGVKEQEGRFSRAWAGTLAWHKRLRAKGAPIGFAPDPRTSHECGDSRYLAIPFFDACLAMRLPGKGSAAAALRPADNRRSWLAGLLTDQAVPAKSFRGNVQESVWLPSGGVAKAWMEYVKTGAVSDATPPPAPHGVRAVAGAENIELTWDAAADFESGIKAFVVERDGATLAQVPENPAGKFGRPLFQAMSYHDTPEAPVPQMRYVDSAGRSGARRQYRVSAVNGAGLKSKPSKPAVLP